MILYFDALGNITTLVPERVYQGSDKANTISIVAPFAISSGMDIRFTLPNGEIKGAYALVNGQRFTDNLNIWNYEIDAPITQYFGSVQFQIRVYNVAGQIIATGSDIFIVEEGIPGELPPTPSDDVYQQILTNIQKLANLKLDRVDVKQVPTGYKYNVDGEKTPYALFYNATSQIDDNTTLTGSNLVYERITGTDNSITQREMFIGYTSSNDFGVWLRTIVMSADGTVTSKTDWERSNWNELTLLIANLQTQINAINGKIDTINSTLEDNASELADHETRITKNTQDIETLQESVITGTTFVGTLTGSELPTNDELATFVQATKGRQPQNGDMVIFIQEIPDATNKNFRYFYSANTWDYYEIPPMEKAKNGTAGIVSGTYGVKDYSLLVDIVDGEIVQIYIKGADDSYKALTDYTSSIATIQEQIENIINGSQSVGNALKLNSKIESQLSVFSATQANNDRLGRDIPNTYPDKDSVYTKTESDNRFLSRAFGILWYLSNQGLLPAPPTEPTTGIQFEQSFANAGTENLFATIDHTMLGNLQLNSGNGYELLPTLAFSRAVECSVKAEIQVKKSADENYTTIGIVTTNAQQFSGGENYPPVTIQGLKGNFSLIAVGESVDLVAGDNLRINIYLTFESSASVNVRLYSSESIKSSFNLVTESIIVIESTGGMKVVEIGENAWTKIADNEYQAIVGQATHQVSPSEDLLVFARTEMTVGQYQNVELSTQTNAGGDITIFASEPLKAKVYVCGGIAKNNAMQVNDLTFNAIVTGTYKAFRLYATNDHLYVDKIKTDGSGVDTSELV